jgi:hypothetical protein
MSNKIGATPRFITVDVAASVYTNVADKRDARDKIDPVGIPAGDINLGRGLREENPFATL